MILQIHVFVYRISNGSLGGRFGGGDVLLLTSIGRKSGKKRTLGLTYWKEGPDYLITASNSGESKNPGWFYNLKKKGKATIQIKKDEFEVSSKIVEGKERDRLWTKIAKENSSYADYQKKTDRKIPVIILSSKK